MSLDTLLADVAGLADSLPASVHKVLTTIAEQVVKHDQLLTDLGQTAGALAGPAGEGLAKEVTSAVETGAADVAASGTSTVAGAPTPQGGSQGNPEQSTPMEAQSPPTQAAASQLTPVPTAEPQQESPVSTEAGNQEQSTPMEDWPKPAA